MKKIFIVFLVFVAYVQGYAQQEPQYSQYLFNGVVINPAYAGSREFLNVNGLYRKQWINFDNTGSNKGDAPTSQTISADVAAYRNRIGLGVYLTNDKLGAQNTSGAHGAFAYRIRVSSSGRLALGMSIGVSQFTIQGKKLVTDEPNDPAIPQHTARIYRPEASTGIYFNADRFFVGLSLDNLLNGLNFKDPFVPVSQRNLTIASGFVASLSNSIKIRPSILVKNDFKSPSNMDITNFFIFKEKLWLGGSYRSRLFFTNSTKSDPNGLQTRDAIALMVQIFPVQRLRIGYAYDITLTDYRNFPTHELSIGLFFDRKSESKMLTPRYF